MRRIRRARPRLRRLLRVLPLTAQQNLAVDTLRACAGYADGWGILTTERGVREVDGQAWIYWRTGMGLVRRGLAEWDEQFGRVRLVNR